MMEPKADITNFNGLRVIAFESRRAVEMATLIRNQAGVATVVPSMREVELESHPEALIFEKMLLAGELDIVIFLTGVGTRMLARELEARITRTQLREALAQTIVFARGPKPVAALREMNITVNLRAPEPNTWREVIATLDAERESLPLMGSRIAIQEYGMTNRQLTDELQARGAEVIRVPVYRWALPEDLGPLQQAVRDIAQGNYDVVLFTTGTQVWHLFKVAAQQKLEAKMREGLQRMVVASIGPTCSEALHEFDIHVDLEPEHPRMGHLVKQAALQSQQLLAARQTTM